jgi:hypothetical protein
MIDEQVPPGATPKEVADDVDVKVSEGEFVIPANVVRYYGTGHFLKLIQKAEEAITNEERLGGSPNKLPFPEEELEATEEGIQQFAAGGLVQPGSVSKQTTKFGSTMYLPSEGGQVASAQEDPLAMKFPVRGNKSVMPQSQSNPSGDQGSYGRDGGPKGTAGSVDKWTLDDFGSYTKQISTQSGKVGTGVMGKIIENIPLSGPFSALRERYIQKAVPETINKMLEAGVDNQGNPLTEEQKTSLKSTLQKHNEYKKPSTNPLEALTSLMKTKEEEKEEEVKEEDSSSSSTESTDSLSDAENQTPVETETETPEEDTPMLRRGGLILRKRK